MRLFAVLLLLTIAKVNAQPTERSLAAPDPAILSEVLITGEQPGPALWKVKKDSGTLWILAMHEPLPAKMTWRSKESEAIIAESQLLVRWVNIETDLDVGFFAGLAALPALSSVEKNPHGKLKDVLPPVTYQQWESLKAKYADRDDRIEKLRPVFAATRLRESAMQLVGLSPDAEPVIWPTLRRLARKHKVKTIEPEVRLHLEIEKPRALLQKFRETPLADIECFSQSLTRLEDDLQTMKLRANAWATGELNVLRQIPPLDPRTDCAQMIQNLILSGQLGEEMGAREISDRARKAIESAHKEANDAWLSTIEAALRQHSSVFAVVPIGNLLESHGLLQSFRDRGYHVDEP